MSQIERSVDFDFEEFLRDYWQQKPLLIKDFFSRFEEPIDASELAGLALEEFIESRIVTHSPPHQYQLERGPFKAERFDELGDSNWTLLVQAVDELLLEVSALKQAFDFLPSWRIDDIMISFAAEGGGVGPHSDFYDVFLIQGSGSRLWKLGEHATSELHSVTDSGLKLLKNFHSKQEVVLEYGDILYIPAGTPHWGISQSPSLCYSVGFRAPSQAEMIESFSDRLIDQARPEERFRDGSLTGALQPGEMALSDLSNAWQALLPRLREENTFLQSFAALVTQPRYPERVVSVTPTQAGIDSTSEVLVRSPSCRFAWLQAPGTDMVWLFVNGELFEQPASNLQAVIGLCDLSIDNIKTIPPASDEPKWRKLLLALICQGSIIPEPDES